MNTRKLAFAFALFALCFLPRVSATIWTGTITQTVTQSDDPLYDIGYSYIGSYQYESDTVDGDFGNIMYAAFNPGAIGTLTGEVFLFSAGIVPIQSSVFSFTAHLTVTNGVVTTFWKEGQIGGVDYGITNSIFGYTRGDLATHFHIQGTVVFSDPVSNVPDESGSAALLACGLASIGLIRNRRR